MSIGRCWFVKFRYAINARRSWKILFFQYCGIAQEQRYTRYGLWLGFCSYLLILQKKPPRENGHKPISSSSTGCLSSPNATVQSPKHEWKIVASEKTSSKCITLVRLSLSYLFLKKEYWAEPFNNFESDYLWRKKKQLNLENNSRSFHSGIWSPIQDHTATKSNNNCILNIELLCLQITLTCAWLCWMVYSV